MDVECEGVTAGEGMWWPLSLVITGDSVFTVLDDDDVAGLKQEQERLIVRGRIKELNRIKQIRTEKRD